MKRLFFAAFILLSSSFSIFAADETIDDVTIDDITFEDVESTTTAPNLIAAVDNLGPTANGFSSEGEFGPGDDELIDPRILRDFIENRGLIATRQKCGQLTLAGDVRARWTATGEELKGIKQRGSGTDTAINLFRSEVNLFFDYATPKSWVTTKLRWSNFDGKDGGTATKVDMDRAFIGYDIYEEGDEDFYIEVGRTKLDYLFDSRLQFGSVFDGVHLYYTNQIPCLGNFVIHGGPFIVDSFTNHYGYAFETGIINWADTGFTFKYSLINWHRRAPTQYYGNNSTLNALNNKLDPFTIINNPRYRYIISQMLFVYERKVDFAGCKTFYAYGAVLMNHDAKRTVSTDYKLLNGAWYAGITLGKLCKACDWSLDINYQSVGAQAVPEFDLTGIGHGNAANVLLSDALILGLLGFPVAATDALCFTNYKGWQVSLMYALTDTLTLRSKAEWTRPLNRSIGGPFNYKNFEMAVIYAF